MAEKTITALTAILGVSMLAVHAHGKRRLDAEDVARVASQLQRNDAWQGKTAPEFELRTLEGGTFRLSEHVGREVVIVNFFATWSGPSRKEMPELMRLRQEMSGRPLVLLAVNEEEKADLVAAFVRELGIAFPVAIDESGDVREAFGVDSVPTTVLIGPDGKVRLHQPGPILNADVAFADLLAAAFFEIQDGKGTTREAFLAAQPRRSGSGAAPQPAATAATASPSPCDCAEKVGRR